MIRHVLADTGPLYALADPSDQYHSPTSTHMNPTQQRLFSLRDLQRYAPEAS